MTRFDRRGFRIGVLFLLALIGVLTAYLLLCVRAADPDMFWHIASGRWIWEHKAIPTTDPFSWWAAPLHKPWIAQEWLFELLIYGVHRVGGFSAVYWFTALLNGVLALSSYAWMRVRKVPPLWSVTLSLVVLAGALGFTSPRPQMVTFVLIVLTSLLLEKGRWPWALVLVLIGVNMHGGVWPLYVLVFAFYEFPKRWWLVLVATAVTVLNPAPVGVFLYPFNAFASPVAARISEFAPTALWSRKGDLLVYLGLILGARNRRVPWRDGLYALAFALLSLSAIRHVAWIYVVVVPVMAPYVAFSKLDLSWLKVPPAWMDRLPAGPRASLARLSDVADKSGAPSAAEPTAAGATVDAALEEPRERRLPGTVLEILLIGTLLLTAMALGLRASRAELDVTKGYPEADTLAYLKMVGAKRIFNVWHEGGYLIYNGIPPLIDGRGDPYGPHKPGDRDLANEFMEVIRLERDVRGFMASLDIDYVIFTRSPLVQAIAHDPAFTAVKYDESHIVFKFDLKALGKPSVDATQTKPSPGQQIQQQYGSPSAGNTAPK